MGKVKRWRRCPYSEVRPKYHYDLQVTTCSYIVNVVLYRQGHAIAVAGDTAYLFGGSGVSDDGSGLFYNDLYSLQCKIYIAHFDSSYTDDK